MCKLDRMMLSYVDKVMVVQSNEGSVAELPSCALCHCVYLCRSNISYLEDMQDSIFTSLSCVRQQKHMENKSSKENKRQCDLGKSSDWFWGPRSIYGCFVYHLWEANRKSLQQNICCKLIFQKEKHFPYWNFEQRYVRMERVMASVPARVSQVDLAAWVSL